MRNLKGVRLMRSKWLTLKETWDHDHCAFCNKDLDASTEEPAYCTENYYHWICEQCYQDFKEAFGWVLVDKPEDDDDWEWVDDDGEEDGESGE